MLFSSKYSDISVAFIQAAAIAQIAIDPSDIDVQYSAAPHTPPPSLPKGKSAVYVFMFGDRCLKVGKAGQKSAARFCNHHYGAGRAPSTLAKSILKNQAKLGVSGLDKKNIGAWIVESTSRVNFLLDSNKYEPFVLSLLEVFVQCRLKPEFEGFTS